MENHECLVCLESPEDLISCTNKECNSLVCSNCIADVIKYATVTNALPKCPSLQCRGYYQYSKLSSSLANSLANTYLNHFSILYEGKVTASLNSSKMLTILRDRRIAKLSEMFPKAILYTAEIALSSKLKNLTKMQKQKQSDSYTLTKKCINHNCTGMLKEKMVTLVCVLCDNEVCKMCEKTYELNHQCKESDIESIEFLNSVIKCPGCGISIEKNTGCDHMNCANCKTHFNYKTGARMGGFHIQLEVVNLQTHTVIDTFRDAMGKEEDSSEYEKVLANIISNTPTEPNITALIRVITSYKNKETTKKQALVKLISTFESYIKQREMYRNYILVTDELIKYATSNKLTTKDLELLLSKI